MPAIGERLTFVPLSYKKLAASPLKTSPMVRTPFKASTTISAPDLALAEPPNLSCPNRK